jgi:hypothetical protein
VSIDELSIVQAALEQCGYIEPAEAQGVVHA